MPNNRLLTVASAMAFSLFSSAAMSQPYGPGMMGGYGGYGFYGPVHLIFWAVVLIAIIVGVVWLVRSLTAPHANHMPPRRSAGLEVLEERYARGEINRDEYLQKKKDIQG